MKNFALVFSVLLITFASCSTSDNTTTANAQDPILVKKIITTYSSTNATTTIFTYNGNKIVSSITTGIFPSKSVYTYTEDLITKTEEYDTTTNLVNRIIENTYLNGVLSTTIFTLIHDGYEVKNVYIHNIDGSISFTDSLINIVTNKETIQEIGKYTYINSNLIKKEYIGGGAGESQTYEYDTKNNPMKNILGYNLLLYMEASTSVNNVTGNTIIYSPNTITASPVYTYNSSNYPTQKIDGTTTTQYFY
jgi:hypothetical protein